MYYCVSLYGRGIILSSFRSFIIGFNSRIERAMAFLDAKERYKSE
jgi:hypothetical protein